VKEGFPEGCSEYLKWALNQYLHAPTLSTEFTEPKAEPRRDIVSHFLYIFVKVFRAVCKVLIDPRKIPTAYITLRWHVCAGVTAGRWYRRRSPAVAEWGHGTGQCSASAAKRLSWAKN